MLYEFQCQKCETVTERIVKLGTEEIECPKCGDKAKKIISTPAIIVKGYNAKNGYSNQTKTDKRSKKDPVS